MSGAHRSTTRANRSNGKNGSHRATPKPARQPYNWLGVGAITLGMGAAMASGTGVASAKGGDGGSSSSSNSSSSSSSGSSTKHTPGADARKQHAKKDKTTGSSSDATSAGASGTTDTTSSDDTDAGTTAGSTPSTGKTKSGKHTDRSTTSSDGGKTKGKSKTKPTTTPAADSSTSTDSPTPAPTAAAPAAATTVPATNKAEPVALAATKAVAAADTGTTTTPTVTTPHATSSNAIVAAIQNAIISVFTATATIEQLVANGLAGPAAPSQLLNPVGAFLYGIFRNIEDFAGLVPKVGTPTTTSDPVTGTVTGSLGFTEPAGGTMTYSVATNPLFGSVTVAADGTYTYKSNIFGAALAALGLNPTDTFTVTASSGPAATNVTVTVPVTAANDVPSTPTSTNQHTDSVSGTVTGTLSSTAPDGQPVTYTILTPPVQGSVTLSTTGGVTTYSYTPTDVARIGAIATSITGLNIDAFSVVATSANGSTSLPGIITVPIEPATSDTPSTPTATFTTNPITGVVTGTISATDPGGAALTYSSTPALLGTVSVNSTTGAFTYTPSAAARAAANPILGVSVVNTDVFTVTASNGTYSSTALITVPITPADNATPSTPTATFTTNPVTGVVTGTISSTDPGGAALTYSYTGAVLGTVTVNSSTGAFTYTPTAAARLAANPILGVSVVNTDAFSVTASNGTYSSTAIITVPITPAASNTPSTPTASNLSTNSTTGVVTGTLSSTSPDGSTITYTAYNLLPTQGSVSISGNTFTYTPTTLAELEASLGLTTASFTVTATNAAGFTSGLATINVPITAVSSVLDFPSSPVSNGQTSNSISGVVTGSVTATDPAGAPLTYQVVTGPAFGTLNFDSATGTYTYTPTNAARTAANPILGVSVVNTDGFTVVATNGTYSSILPTLITVPIAPAANDTPSAPTATQNQNIYSGVVTGTLSSTSPDGSTITYSISPNLLGNNTTTNSGLVLSTSGGVTTYTYTPTMSARNNANSILSGGLGITSDSFTITATNSAGLSSSSTITVPISPASNDTPTNPTVSGQNQNIYSGVVTGTLNSTSPDGSTITYSITPNLVGNNTTTGSGLTLSTVGGVTTFTYTPTRSARDNAQPILSGGLGITTDSFTITATNTTGFSNSATITVPISPSSNDTPSATSVVGQNQNLTTGVVTGTLSATSPDGSAITYSINPNLVGNNTTTNSGLTLSTTGGVTTFTYTPTPSARNNAQPLLGGGLGITTDSFSITATNTTGYSSTTTITVPISPSSNDTPTGSVVNSSYSNHKTTGTITGTSPDGSVVTYSIANQGLSAGTLTINPTTGAFTIASAQVIVYFSGTVTFTVTNSSGFSYSFNFNYAA